MAITHIPHYVTVMVSVKVHRLLDPVSKLADLWMKNHTVKEDREQLKM